MLHQYHRQYGYQLNFRADGKNNNLILFNCLFRTREISKYFLKFHLRILYPKCTTQVHQLEVSFYQFALISTVQVKILYGRHMSEGCLYNYPRNIRSLCDLNRDIDIDIADEKGIDEICKDTMMDYENEKKRTNAKGGRSLPEKVKCTIVFF